MFHSEVVCSVNTPYSIAFNKSGELVVTSYYEVDLILLNFSQHCIKKINKNGELIHVAGKECIEGNVDGSEALFSYPAGIDIDENDFIYVVDLNKSIRKVDPNG